MHRQLIVVVHGVGVREAGASTDMLSSALAAPPVHDRPAPLTQAEREARNLPPEPALHPHSTDDFHLHEAPRHARGGLRRTFPARIRRYRRYLPAVPGQPAAPAAERVVADFFWGDIPATGQDALRLVAGFVRIVLGLAHVIRESACEVFPGRSRIDAAGRWLSILAPLILHGPILAINLVLLVGFLVHLGLAWAFSETGATDRTPEVQTLAGPVSGLITGVLAGLAAALRLPRAPSYLERHTWVWVLVAGVAASMLAAAGGIEAWRQAVEGQAPGDFGVAGPRGLVTIEAQAKVLVLAMLACWAAAFVCALAAGGMAVARRCRDAGTPPALILPAFGLMTCLWFAVLAAAWALLLQLVQSVRAPKPTRLAVDQIEQALAGALPAAAALVALVGVGLALHLGKAAAMAGLSLDDAPRSRVEIDRRAEAWRLILSPWLAAVLVLFLVASAGLAALILAGGECKALCPLACAPGPSCDCACPVGTRLAGWARGLTGWALTPPGWVTDATRWVLAALALLATVLFVWLRAPFAQGLAIVTDIVVWLNDLSWRTDPRTDPPPTLAPVRRTPLERTFGYDPPAQTDATPRGYWLRQRIQDRLSVMMATLIRDENPDEIVLIAHSQGTMIALDLLEQQGAEWRGTGRRLTLITMGSPVRHLYGHYFPRAWPGHRARPVLARPRAPDAGPAAPEVLDRWVNIWRIDDFVGTQIDVPQHPGPQWPHEYPVPPNGHTNYWRDPEVFTRIELELRF